MKSLRKIRRTAGQKSFWQRLVFSYRVDFVNEDELRRVMHLKMSRLKAVILSVAAILSVAGLTLYMYEHSPRQLHKTDREYAARQQMVDDALRVDSLEQIMAIQQHYVRNLQDILLGRISADTVYTVDSLTRVREQQIPEASDLERSFSNQYEERERYNISNQSQTVTGLSTLNFLRPAPGVVVTRFDAQMNHYGVDIATNPNSSVVAVLDGTVVMSTFTPHAGYVTCIAHSGDVLSIYENCSSVLKKQGEKVKAGEVIGLSIKTDQNKAEKPHLHFELWYSGQPLDPERYIVF